ncbi:T9SS type B sorting domain-containing protein [Flagellimonas pelagia]|uniref:T9SS type B sorting domain-containing protein n=1 Tax=Flagellimonas pelagia TaxID=2306998 RepID=A0A3A1NMX9_9FLAO|nr:T9SS type B sorting domain-containing protein [Allomuricauda maritima]RIV45339.1 hypothetical protein D2V05_07160 [Allomuricauda maritima]TXJ96815.1 T9SS type B sorting domain-containing protein [Allomuricauda maritima]
MLNRKLLFLVLLMGVMAHAQNCPDLLSPAEGAVNVPLNTTISWNPVDGVNAFIISLGTTPGGNDIVSPKFVSGTTYTPPLGLPENETIYVTISLYFYDGPDITCPSISFTTESLTQPPASCATMTQPSDMATNVNPKTNISWNYVYGATGYLVRLGTTAGGNDILEQDVGNRLTLNPDIDLPAETPIFATIIPYNDIGTAMGCSAQQFTTGMVSDLPECTSMTYPPNGETNVPLTTELEWNEVAGATSYYVTIGTTPTSSDILDNSRFYTNSTPIFNLEPNKTYFITISPSNETGTAMGCQKESFTTSFGCGPYWDVNVGDFVTINPEIDFPDTISFCENEAPYIAFSTDVADGYRWYKVDDKDNETLLSETSEVAISENGTYRYEAYNLVDREAGTLECPTTKIFHVVSSEMASIDNLRVQNSNGLLSIQVEASGIGDYEFAIDNMNGPYSDSSVFSNIEPGNHTLYVRDKNGCGVAQEAFIQDLTLEGFPKFFTPNGDNINDYWQFIQPEKSAEVVFQSIRIFDRYGKFLKQISQDSQGWDGRIAGRPLPSGDYWFVAIDDSNQEIKGHFSLKR